MDVLLELENFINEFNNANDEKFMIDSIRVEYQKQYKQADLNLLGKWHKLNKNNQTILAKLKKRLGENQVTNVYKLAKYNIYYFNKKDTATSNKKYRNAEMVIFGMSQYHKAPPPRELIRQILSILKSVTNIDVCLDLPYKPNLTKLKQIFTLTPYITSKGTVTDTVYINKPEITMIEKVVIYNKQLKNNLGFQVWRVEAKMTVPNLKILALPLYEFKQLIDLLRDKQALSIAKEIQ